MSKRKSEPSKRALESRWGKNAIDVNGWTGIPNLLLERQQELKIDPLDLNILLVLCKHWWEEDKMPYPSKATIADIVGREKSTVQTRIRGMEQRGLLKRVTRKNGQGGQGSNEYDLSGLVKKLRKLAKSEQAVKKAREEEDGRRRRGRGKANKDAGEEA